MLERARQRLMRKRKSVEGEVTLRSKRKLNLTSAHCIFCDETNSESLHEFPTLNVDQVIRDMASEMGDSDLLVKLSGGIDNIAVETQQQFFLMKIKPLLLLYLILARSGSAENHFFCHVWKLLIIRLYIKINLIARYLMVLPWCTS